MPHSRARVKLVSFLLALTLAPFGVQPCAASDMENGMGPMSGHQCGEPESRPVALDEAPSCAEMPADCCAFSAPTDRPLPAQPIGASKHAPAPLLASAAHVVRAVVSLDVPATAEAPPAGSAVPRHLLLSVLLI